VTPRRAHLSGPVLVFLGVVLLVAAIGHPRVAQATCGGVYAATVKPSHGGVLPPLAIGDSTLILSVPTLKREGISANAQGCRQYSEGLDMLNTLRRQGRLARVVIVALGANGPVTESEVTAALGILGPRRILVMVTHWQPGHRSGPDTALIRREPRRHPGRIVVLDWILYSSGHRAWFQPDGLHLTFPGAAVYARFLGRAIPLTQPPATPARPSQPPTR